MSADFAPGWYPDPQDPGQVRIEFFASGTAVARTGEAGVSEPPTPVIPLGR